MPHNQPSSPVLGDQDLQQIYEQVSAGFDSEEDDTLTTNIESSSITSRNSTFSADFSFFTAESQPRTGNNYEKLSEAPADKDKEGDATIHSTYAAHPFRESTSSYQHRHRNSDFSYDDFLISPESPVSTAAAKKPWKDTVPEGVLSRIGEEEVNRQVEIHDLVAKETEYLEQLIILETDFLRPLTEWVKKKEDEREREQADVGRITSASNYLPLLRFSPALHFLLRILNFLIASHTRLLEDLHARESQHGIIEQIGDLYLERAAGEWKAGWGNGWVEGKGFVSGGGEWTGDSGYDEWVAVWTTSGLGGLNIFSDNNKSGMWGSEEWKAVVAEQMRVHQMTGAIVDERGRTRYTTFLTTDSVPDIDLKRFSELLVLPVTHFQLYPSFFSTILSSYYDVTSAPAAASSPSGSSTDPAARKDSKHQGGKEKGREENPDESYLREAIRAMRALWGYAKVKTFQMSMNIEASENNGGKGSMGDAAVKWEWFDLTSEEERKEIGKAEMKRQAIIFELIKGEMRYVRDLENVEHIYIAPLQNASTSVNPITPAERLPQFIQSVFSNINALHSHHLRLLQSLFRIQYDEKPTIRSISAPILDAALNWREAYTEYIPNYPIATYTIDSEMRINQAFREFVQRCTRHPDAHRLDMKNFINRPIPRLLRHELLLKGILEETPSGPLGVPGSSRQGASSSRGLNGEHEDHTAIPQVLDVIRRLGKDTEPGVQGEWIDMDWLDEHRSLIYSGKLLRQTDGLERDRWTELYVLSFVVMIKVKEHDEGRKYRVDRRPIPLDLLTIDSLTDAPVQRSPYPSRLTIDSLTDVPVQRNTDRSIFQFPFEGRIGLSPNLYAESERVRTEWRAKLQEASTHRATQGNNKVFEVKLLGGDTFLTRDGEDGSSNGSYGDVLDSTYCRSFTGKIPQIEENWSLLSVRKVSGLGSGMSLTLVSQCAVLGDYGLFLVLADKQLFAYLIDALVPSSPLTANVSQVVQKLSGSDDVHFFTVGILLGRTLVIYMRKRGLDSIFRVLEPVSEKIHEQVNAPSRFGSISFPRSPNRSTLFPHARISSYPLNQFGVYVDQHGNPSRAVRIIEWEGDAERIAVHAQSILRFDSRFIEIRSLETGRLAQIIPGSDIRCIWDGRGVSSLNAIQNAQVHAVMNTPETVIGLGPRAIIQQVIEILPTVS
ncbi:hypothetical protein GYMLUDRAFT_247376 [Collybiopsis luxurians FD-317 M1]|uniref:DH domain-containing protein n=1 Tax=Collybiopsis luxurians FD-317 M1 TaxID=944289 RepID=A0A0D0CPB0_9AGAR|nr:hypothetical protein GYMLUDRAFT_247376 [Collybiopsis luxurians FD-317 M1]